MAKIEFNTNQQRRVPITRNGLFYDREQFAFDMEMGREYVEGDLGQRIVLYSVDLAKTNQDQLYGESESKKIVCKPPIEIPCVYEIEEAELKGYDKNKNLGIYQKQGKIKFGDFIGVQVTERQMVYFQVENDGRNNYDNAHTQFGTTPLYRSMTASWVDPAIFNG